MICYFPAPNCDQTAKSAPFSQNTVSLSCFLDPIQATAVLLNHFAGAIVLDPQLQQGPGC